MYTLVYAAGSYYNLTFILFLQMHPKVFYDIELVRRIHYNVHMQGCQLLLTVVLI